MPYPTRPSNNYCVRKWSDVDQYLTAEERRLFIELIVKIDTSRMSRQIANRDYVVVSNKNRQMYEEVWGMVMGEASIQETRQETMLSGNIWDQVRTMSRNRPASVETSPTFRTLGGIPSDGREVPNLIWTDEVTSGGGFTTTSDMRTMVVDTDNLTVSGRNGNTRVVMGRRVTPNMAELEASIERAWERQNEPTPEPVEEDELIASYDVQEAFPTMRDIAAPSRWEPGVRWTVNNEGDVVRVRQSNEDTDFVDVD